MPGARVACGSMKKNQTVQGTFSKIFGKKHASPSTTSLYVTNPPWIFTQEAPEEGPRVLGKCARGRACGPRLCSAFPAAGTRRERGGGKRHVGTCGPAGKELRGREVAPSGVSGNGLWRAEARKVGTLPTRGRRPWRTASDPSLPSQVFPFPPRWKLGLLPGGFLGRRGSSSPSSTVESEGAPTTEGKS